MRLNNLLPIATLPSPSTPSSNLPPPSPDAVDRILSMADAPRPSGSGTSPTAGRPLYVQLPQGKVPMVSGVQVRALVDKLGLAFLPEAYVREEVRRGDTSEAKQSVVAFKIALGKSNDFYIVAPMEAMNVAAMVTGDVERPVYVAPSERDAYRSLFMMLPFMIATSKRLTRLEERVAAVEEGVQGLERELGRMRKEREGESKRSEDAAARWALSRDPMIIAVPKGVDPSTAEMVIAGPAWGPEFGESELRALGIEPAARSVASELSPLLATILR